MSHGAGKLAHILSISCKHTLPNAEQQCFKFVEVVEVELEVVCLYIDSYSYSYMVQHLVWLLMRFLFMLLLSSS